MMVIAVEIDDKPSAAGPLQSTQLSKKSFVNPGIRPCGCG
jgi:hypothetical protein